MFYAASKVLGFVATPSNALALLCAFGFVLLRLRRRGGVALLGTGLAVLLIAGFSPLGHLLLLPLSERFPAWQDDGRGVDGVIVLGGAIDPDVSEARGALEMDAAGERIVAMLQLARRYPTARIVYSGGSGNFLHDRIPEAPVAGRLLAEFGVAPARIMLESQSRTTAENAAQTRALLAPKQSERWLLVTSAFHMPRAIGLYRKAGFDVTAYPVDFRTRGWQDAARAMRTLGAGLQRCDVAMHEWAGLLAAYLAGQSDAVLPAP